MTSLPYNYSSHTRFHRQGWVYSVVFHAMMTACAVALMSELTLSVEPNSYQWNVALVESPGPQPTVDPLSDIKPDPPLTPNPAKSRPTPLEPTAKPVQHQIARHQIAQIPQDVSEVTLVNQTASTVLAQPVEHHEDAPVIEQATTEEKILEEEQAPANEAISNNESIMSAVESLISQPATDSLVQQPTIETASETLAQVQQLSAEQMVASAAPFKAAPATKADYGWLMRALQGRIDELKNYPVMARMNRWEGRVVLRAVIKDDGQVLMVNVQESSGRLILDNDAMETLKKASPLKLDHPLGKPQVAILMPISYSLR
jgi:protein TonB